jgi:hypothetical protein
VAYPDVLVYNGAGSTDNEASFHCEEHLQDDPGLLGADVLGTP